MSALYMSMSANDSDLVIEDDLAKGRPCYKISPGHTAYVYDSPEDPAGVKVEDLISVQEELRLGEGRPIP
jgi:hypothetical protein